MQARLPEITDDPRNPYSFSIKQLNLARQYNELSSKRKTVLEQLKEGYKGLDYVPVAGGTTAPVQPIPVSDIDSVVQKVEYALYLLNGKDSDKAEAKKVLGDLLKELKKK